MRRRSRRGGRRLSGSDMLVPVQKEAGSTSKLYARKLIRLHFRSHATEATGRGNDCPRFGVCSRAFTPELCCTAAVVTLSLKFLHQRKLPC